MSQEYRDNIINLFKTLLSRTTKYDLANKYKYESILGKDLLSNFFTIEYGEVPTLLNLSNQSVKKILYSRNKAYLAEVRTIPKTLQNQLISPSNEILDESEEADKFDKLFSEPTYCIY